MDPESIGVDSSTAQRPGVPAERTPEPLARYAGGLARQRAASAIQVSADRTAITPVFGVTVAPKGVSGLLRRSAYRMHEHRARRWMLLLLADRVDVLESRLARPTSARARVVLFGVLAAAVVILMRRRAARAW